MPPVSEFAVRLALALTNNALKSMYEYDRKIYIQYPVFLATSPLTAEAMKLTARKQKKVVLVWPVGCGGCGGDDGDSWGWK